MKLRESALLSTNDAILAARAKWQFTGSVRPAFAQQPQPGQESVWDYPRPPRIEPVTRRLRVYSGSSLIAQSSAGVRVLETAGAPTYYFPPDDVDGQLLSYGEVTSLCEWKGAAQTITIDGLHDAGWRYVQVFEEFAALFEWPSFYPGKLRCFVDDEQAVAQPGGYYGGWVTSSLAGPIKGEPRSQSW